jgi:hypothetical protein
VNNVDFRDPVKRCRLGHDTHVHNPEAGARDLMNRFVLVPCADASAEEHARHAVNLVAEMAARRAAKELSPNRSGIMIWVARALAAVAVMMLIYALILRFWPA